MADISLTVANKVVTASSATKDFVGVCNNTGYTLEVTLDNEWSGLSNIKAVFRSDDDIQQVSLTDGTGGVKTCNIPAFDKDGLVQIGICQVTKSGQTVQSVKSTTAVQFKWKRSVLSGVSI